MVHSGTFLQKLSLPTREFSGVKAEGPVLFSDRDYFGRGEASVPVLLSPAAGAVSDFVAVVFRASSPAQVDRAVVGLIPVYVSDFMLKGRLGPQKGVRYQAVNTCGADHGFETKHYAGVVSFGDNRLADESVAGATHPPEIAHFTAPALDRSPSLMR